MQDDLLLQKLHRIVGPDMLSLQRHTITQDRGRYQVFGDWEIIQAPDQAQVYHNGDLKFMASNVRTAMSWCVAERHRRFELSRDIARWDQQVQRVQRDIAHTAALLPRVQDPDLRHTIQDKLQLKRQLLREAKNRLSKCIGRAKYIQIRGFNDEIARTRRLTPICTTGTGSR